MSRGPLIGTQTTVHRQLIDHHNPTSAHRMCAEQLHQLSYQVNIGIHKLLQAAGHIAALCGWHTAILEAELVLWEGSLHPLLQQTEPVLRAPLYAMAPTDTATNNTCRTYAASVSHVSARCLVSCRWCGMFTWCQPQTSRLL